jgi:uncharacterized phage protein gp47/JayE
MAYFPPYSDASGFHIPTYDDILAYLREQFLSVYGQSVYSGLDSADEQWIRTLALMMNDCFRTSQLVINARSPATAVGADLDNVVKINGITRKSATSSTAVLVLTGIPGTVLQDAIAQDSNGYLWDIPQSTVLVGGSIAVSAICENVGAIKALAGTINIRSTPIAGWTGVTNPADAIIGQPIENDSQLRARQAISVSLSSKTLVDATLAGIATVAGVTRYATVGVENPTGATDSYGNPPHSISMVVEGGLDLDIATAIYNNKTPGCLTNGTNSTSVTDPNNGSVMNIGWSRPTYLPIYVSLNIHPLQGYTSATTVAIQNSLTSYLNGLQIGESLTISGLYYAAMSVMPNPLLPQYSVRALFAGTAPSPSASSDINLNYNQVVSGSIANVIISLV